MFTILRQLLNSGMLTPKAARIVLLVIALLALLSLAWECRFPGVSVPPIICEPEK